MQQAELMSTSSPTHHLSLRDYVINALHTYFTQLEDCAAANLHELVLTEVEAPLLETVLRHVKGNQSKAAAILGLSRGTLRKKLKQYQLD